MNQASIARRWAAQLRFLDQSGNVKLKPPMSVSLRRYHGKQLYEASVRSWRPAAGCRRSAAQSRSTLMLPSASRAVPLIRTPYGERSTPEWLNQISPTTDFRVRVTCRA